MRTCLKSGLSEIDGNSDESETDMGEGHNKRVPNRAWIEWRQRLVTGEQRSRKVRLVCATPPWVDADQLESIYIEAWRLRQLTGIPFEVDHIVPVAGETVSGLHVPWNLQIIPAGTNARKGITFDETNSVGTSLWSPRRVELQRGWCPVTGTWRSCPIRIISNEEAEEQGAKIRMEIVILEKARRKLQAGAAPSDLPAEVFAFLSKPLVEKVWCEMQNSTIAVTSIERNDKNGA